MISSKWLLNQLLKNSTIKYKSSGFTLIELLVAMILATLVITPLLGFMINILDSDRREQAKANTEQELKATLDFIARDLEQAVYIYDDTGINAIRNQLPPVSATTHFPVLVFWKRQYIKNGIGITTTSNNCNTQPERCDDTFSYSLVAYYLIKENSQTWSNAARIGRFQISDGYGDTDQAKAATRDAGFQLFDLTGTGDLITKMNRWTRNGTYNQQILTVVDYIDRTQTTASTSNLANCPANPTNSFHVCVDSANTVAEVFLRGNALARFENTPPNYSEQTKNYFPQARVRIEGRGFVFTK
ncbi:MAG: prepilin-type N-terminal cleavage/methylation domain-containing protein [Richelia sp. RM1_1_1]|nr:prepilin-type N-terminal cleavage/methylation domain-containing protein [Richelia sp. RM1_1_1]